MAFKYVPRAVENVAKRATQSGGDFKGFILNDFSTWSPKKGENWIRILPPTWDNAEHFGYDAYVHYGIGPENASVLCLAKTHNQQCPICEARAKAEKAGDEALAKELKINKRVLVWLIDRIEPSKGPLIWAMPWTVDRDICKISKDKQTGDLYVIDHPTEGYDLMFDKEGEGVSTKYTGLQLARRASSVDSGWLDYISEHPLPDILLLRDYDETLALYEGAAAVKATASDHHQSMEKPDQNDPERASAQPTERRIIPREVARPAPEPAPSRAQSGGDDRIQSLKEKLAARRR